MIRRGRSARRSNVSEAQFVGEIGFRLFQPIEVTGDREMLGQVALPGRHRAAIGLSPVRHQVTAITKVGGKARHVVFQPGESSSRCDRRPYGGAGGLRHAAAFVYRVRADGMDESEAGIGGDGTIACSNRLGTACSAKPARSPQSQPVTGQERPLLKAVGVVRPARLTPNPPVPHRHHQGGRAARQARINANHVFGNRFRRARVWVRALPDYRPRGPAPDASRRWRSRQRSAGRSSPRKATSSCRSDRR